MTNSMTNSRIEEALERYEFALTALEQATSSKNGIVKKDGERKRKQSKKLLPKVRKPIELRFTTSKNAYHILHLKILDVLIARDAVQEVLEDKAQDSSEKLINIIKLDQRLKKQAKSIVKAVNLDDWRASVNPPSYAWWWFIEERFGLWAILLSILCLFLSLSFIGDIAPRFLTGGPEFWGNIVVILQGIFVMVAGGSVFSNSAGRKLAHVFPRKFWHKWGTWLSLLSLAFSVLLYQSLPQIAIYYRDLGLTNYKAGRLVNAQFNYERALALNPNDGVTHFYLGVLYENLQDLNGARIEYQTAMRSNFAAAFNNMARLYILDEDYARATVLLRRLKTLITPEDNMTLRYNLHRNLGWIYLKQKNLPQAEAELLTAIEDLAKPARLIPERQASAYCLLAQVLDAKGDTDQASQKWEYCLRYTRGLLPEEAAWLKIGQERSHPKNFHN